MPPKKKTEGKVKKREKVKKEEEDEEKKPKKPTEKEIFEMKIEQLKQELGEADDVLQHHKEALEHARQILDAEEKNKLSCIAHLQRVLQAENDKRMHIQERLQTERDLAELLERRALGKFAASDRSSEAAKSLFLQQKMELEGKLSLLEELRLERNSQRAHLKKVEDALNEKMSALREKSREEDMKQVGKLLKNREVFLKLCQDIRAEWREAFKLRLPVHAKRQLEENIRLRDICGAVTEDLLDVQDANRTLKELQKSFELEEEIQSSIEDNEKKRKICQEKRLKRLLDFSKEIQSETMQGVKPPSSCPKNEDAELLREENSFLKQTSEKDNHTCHSPKSAINCRITSIRKHEIEQCQLQDRLQEIEAILKDQMGYKDSLQSDLEANIDRNGTMISAILRSGKIFQTRCGKLSQEDLDYDTLHQIRNLLNIPTN